MTPEQFTYWLQGFAEVNQTNPDPKQWQIIKDHLKLVFDKKTQIYPQTGQAIPAPDLLTDIKRKMAEDAKRRECFDHLAPRVMC